MTSRQTDGFASVVDSKLCYFVHSFYVPTSEHTLTTTQYGQTEFVSSIQRGNLLATQFHPEKSGKVGLQLLDNFIKYRKTSCSEFCFDFSFLDLSKDFQIPKQVLSNSISNQVTFAKRIVACLDVRSNDQGDLVVTKGDQYDVREASSGGEKGEGTREPVTHVAI